MNLIGLCTVPLLPILLCWLTHYWIVHKQHAIDDAKLHAVARQHAVKFLSIERTQREIGPELKAAIPGIRLLPTENREWIFVNCGGWMGAVYILYASFTEYILLFGTAVDTVGHSGRYWANISDTLLSGSFSQWPEGTVFSRSYKPGDTIYHEWGNAAAVQWSAGTWMVEYGRGFLPSTLPFALADSIFSTLDVVSAFKLLKSYSLAILHCYGIL